MLLLCLLGVILVIGGLALWRELGTFLSDVRLALFGAPVRARIPARRPEAVPPEVPPLQLGNVPPPTVVTRPRR
jgi:hypothetical protein